MKKGLALVLALVLAVSVLYGCGSSSKSTEESAAAAETAAAEEAAEEAVEEAVEEAAEGTELVVLGRDSLWEGLDICQCSAYLNEQTLHTDTLAIIDEDGNVQPSIASAVEVSEDGKTITFTIPEDFQFSTGETLLPEDVVASLERVKEISPMGSQLETVESIEEDGQNVVLHLSAYSEAVMPFLCGLFCGIYDKDELDSLSQEEMLWGCHPYGLYALEEYQEGSCATFVRNEYYKTNNPLVENKGPAEVAQIKVQFLADDFSAASSINAGDIDYMDAISSDLLAQIEVEDAQYYTYAGAESRYIIFNANNAYLSDVNVRQAIARALDREKLAADTDGAILTQYAYVTSSMSCYSEEFADTYKADYSDDMEAAKALLEKSGWTDSDGDGYVDKDGETLSLVFTCEDITIDSKIAQSIQNQLKDLGIQVELNTCSDYYSISCYMEGNYDMGMIQLGTDDGVMYLQLAFTVDPDSLNTTGKTDEYMALVDKVNSSAAAEDRVQYATEAQAIIAETGIAIPMGASSYNAYINDKTAGIVFVKGLPLFNDLK